MGLIKLNYEDGQTPLDPDEMEGLLMPSITTRRELDEFEQNNIEKAILWTMERRKKFTLDEVLSESFILEIHKKMFGEVWRWAGQFRLSNKNIGVDKYSIAIQLRILLDDCKHWKEQAVFPGR